VTPLPDGGTLIENKVRHHRFLGLPGSQKSLAGFRADLEDSTELRTYAGLSA
jgi:hypothetical protein